MYLKSLNVVGFKSFADRTTLEFDRGITAIVGPNGCGKSNVLDSIRWVLGEQSAKALRGDEMKDVIFSGTEARPPLGMAEVSLTFGDCEEQLGVSYNEVTITRRVFRDGAGEYELNKTPCRLRDIHNLFMDTGVGRTAYSIMEQGKIDQILSSRPEDRRAVFDEAAGITKYKSQKKEAMRKLENTEANLLRLADIIREVKRQIGSLQRQAGKARRYQSAFDELASLESLLGRHQFELYSQTIESLQREVDAARERQDRLEEEVGGQEARVAENRELLAGTETDLNRLREEWGAIRHALENSELRAATNEARVTEFDELSRQARQEIAGTEERVRVGEEQLASLNVQIEELGRRCGEIQQRFDGGQSEARDLAIKMESAESEAAEREQEAENCGQKILRHEQELAALEVHRRNRGVRLEALRSVQENLMRRKEDGGTLLGRAVAHRTGAQDAIEKSRVDLAQAQKARGGAEEEFKTEQAAFMQSGQGHQKIQARLEALRQLEERHASAPQAAQRLLEEQANADELHGTLAEHIRVEPGYEAPMSLLLGESVNALVLGDGEQARTWRDKLVKGEKCAFVPLTAARPCPLGSQSESHACRFVITQPLVASLVASLLEDAHIVDDLGAAWALKSLQPHFTIATRAGELITRGGLLFVGQDTGASFTALIRKNEIAQLEEEILKAAALLASAQKRVDDARAGVERQSGTLDRARSSVQEGEVVFASHRQEEKRLEMELAHLKQELESTQRELAQLTTQESRDEEADRGLRDSISEIGEARRQADEQLDEARAALVMLGEEEAALKSSLTEVRIELATVTQQRESARQQSEPVHARLRELGDLIRQRRRESAEHEKRVIQAREEIEAAAKAKAEQAEAHVRVGLEVAAAQSRRVEVLALIETEETALKTLRRTQADLHQARSQHEVHLAEQKLLFNNLRERFRRDYHKELEDLPADEAEATAVLDWVTLEIDVAAKRSALDAIGPVNLEAITEYDELEQRHRFLTGQESDLLGARDQILKAIQEINRTTQKLFAETFAQVQRNFQEMFTELFGGGKASLTLMDESDPLKSGIEIVARPPGKQNQNVSLLSGGERTMTAVALLFAIYMVKPSPFCVLDELDAPLDESNINRFIKIVQRFVKHSQFVIITHNKRTISMANVLYGVTMEERGISRFVSTRLRKDPGSPEALSAAVRKEPTMASAGEG